MGSIRKRVEYLTKKYDTNDPFKLAEALGYIVMFEDLGRSFGYFSNLFRIPVIHVNVNTSTEQQLFTVAHELGHAVLHKDTNTAFLKQNTLYSTEKIEVEANQFAVELLFNQGGDDIVTIKEATEVYGVPEQLLHKNF